MAPRSLSHSFGGGEHRAHAQRLDVQRDVEILGGHREQVLRQALARVGVEIAAHDAADVGELVGGQPGTAAEHHVFHRVRGAGESRGRLVGAGEVVDRGRHHRRERVAHDDHAQPVGERGAQHTGAAAPAAIRATRR